MIAHNTTRPKGKPYLIIERNRDHDCYGAEIWHGPWQWFLVAPKRSPMIEILGPVEELTVEAALRKAFGILYPVPSLQWISRRSNRILESGGKPVMMTAFVGSNWNVYDLRTGSAQMIGTGLTNWQLAKMLAEDTLSL